MVGTIWALLPALIAIVMALVTRQVYISLFLGLLVGAMCLTGGNVLLGMERLVECIAENIFGDFDHAYIIMFVLCLGILVVMITSTGGSLAYGEWATKKIKTKRGALLSTFGLGVIIFIDDYFNCLTVGNVMRPVTDKHKISREKLAYIIDSTAAPICIIAPISSWAAAVGSTLGIENGFEVFIKSIPFNIYAWLTIALIMIVAIKDFNFSLMKKVEEDYNPENEAKSGEKIGGIEPNKNGKVIDLILPIIVLVILSIFFMLYTGGVFENGNIVKSFSDCNAGKSLSMSSLITITIFFIYYLVKKQMTFHDVGEIIIEGFKTMAPTILVLVLAWSLGSMCSSEEYLALKECEIFENLKNLGFLFPAVIFIISALISFSTGTSWGTFAILLPLVPQFIADTTNTLFFIGVAAVLGGAVCGDHMSPMSDTTILSGTGAGCDGLSHVRTQLPYALLVCACTFMVYLILGVTLEFVKDSNYTIVSIIALILGLLLLFGVVFAISTIDKKRKIKKDLIIESDIKEDGIKTE